MEDQQKNPNVAEVMGSIESQTLLDENEFGNQEPVSESDKCENCDISSSVYLFRMVFQSAQKPDASRKNQQSYLTWILTGILIAQVIWAMVLIPFIVFE